MRLSKFVELSIIGVLSGFTVGMLLENEFTSTIRVLSTMGMIAIVQGVQGIFFEYGDYRESMENLKKIDEEINRIRRNFANHREHKEMHIQEETFCNIECFEKNLGEAWEKNNENK